MAVLKAIGSPAGAQRVPAETQVGAPAYPGVTPFTSAGSQRSAVVDDLLAEARFYLELVHSSDADIDRVVRDAVGAR